MTSLKLGVSGVFLAILTFGCAGEKRVVAPERLVAPAARAERAPAPDGVVIDDRVLAACGLPSNGDAPHFAFDSADLAPSGRDALDQLARCMLEGALKGKRLRLVGRTDPRGEDEYNMALGGQRAETVARYLHERGVPDERLVRTSRGKLDAQGNDESTWALDRRVDVELPAT